MTTSLKLRVSFYPRHGKTSKVELTPVMLRVSLNGERATFGQVPIEVSPLSMVKGKISDSEPDAFTKNEQLRGIEADLRYLAKDLYKKGVLSIDSLRRAYIGDKPSNKYISALFDEIINDEKKKYEAGLVGKGTYNHSVRMKSVFLSFIGYALSRKDILLTEVTKSLMIEFEFYLNAKAQYAHNTLIKHLRFVVSALNYAVTKGYLQVNPIASLAYNEEPTDRGYLTTEELQKLETIALPEHLDLVRDVFLFSCYTGISYRDVFNLTEKNLCTQNGNLWIVFKRQKTHELSQVFLLDKAIGLISKYETVRPLDGRLLPVFSNQAINRQLKKIATLCKIEKNVTYHLARHTFATLSLTNGVSIETVSKTLGHTSIRTTQLYARILPKKMSDELSKLNHLL